MLFFGRNLCFTSKSWSHNCYLLLSFLLYLCDLYLNFFQITKGLRFNSYPVSLPNFSFLPLTVNPVDMTKYWCYFLLINFVIIYGTTTKFGIRMHYPTFQCTKFQGNWIMHLCFITTFTPLQKKMKKLSRFSKVHISEMPSAI